VLKLVERIETSPFSYAQTRARHILIRPADQSAQATVMSRMQAYRRDVLSGAKTFEQLAKDNSEDGSAAQGGDLGWANPGMFVPEFEQVMNALPIKGISEPFMSRFGVHLIQVLERRNVELEPKQIREQARNVLREQRFEEANEKWVKEIRAQSFIEMRESPQ
jgi:peptidyl-prolyl cis-trans isomerase SurA